MKFSVHIIYHEMRDSTLLEIRKVCDDFEILKKQTLDAI